MDEKKKKDIALFRYGLISPIIHESVCGQMKYFRQISNKIYNVPHLGKRRYKPETLKCWLRDYRNGGFDGLKPKTRVDKGASRKIDDALGSTIKEKVERFRSLSCSGIYRLLVSEGKIDAGQIAVATLRKYICDKNLKKGSLIKARKKYEKEHINELWIGDCMHGPYILGENKKKKKVFLIAIIDDRSRMIVGGEFFHHENSVSLECILKQAIRRFGLPKMFYCDNGSMFTSSHLHLACARLGISLVHSKPYDSPSRGKIERFFRGIRQRFLPFVNLSDIDSLEQVNTQFARWLDKEYHKHHHHGIEEKPIDRFMQELKTTHIRRVSEEELDRAFQITITRKVKNDATISVSRILYECPPKYIGKLIQVRYPSDRPEKLTIYENDKPVLELKKVNIYENASPPAWGITFNKEDTDD